MTNRTKIRHLFANLAKITAGLVIFVVMLEGVLQIAFNSLPRALTQRMPQAPIRYGIQFNTSHGAREYPASENVDIIVNSYTGDLFELTCLSPTSAPETTPYSVQYTRDDHGFRNPTPWPDDVDMVVVGDSFTAAEIIQYPFWQDIVPSTSAFGLPGSGSLEQSLLLREFGLPRSPEIVVMAYFGGNDISDTWRFHQARLAGETIYSQTNRDRKPWEYLVTFHALMLVRDLITPEQRESCAYPLSDSQGNQLAFYDEFLSQATVGTDDLLESEIFAVTRDTILSAAEETQNMGATFVLVYLPHKAQTHQQLLSAEQILSITGVQPISPLTPTEEGFTTRQDLSIEQTSILLNQNMDAQRDLLAELAEDAGFLFLDLTPQFREAAANGIATYFFGDTHWNQEGHNLARDTLRDFFTQHGLLND